MDLVSSFRGSALCARSNTRSVYGWILDMVSFVRQWSGKSDNCSMRIEISEHQNIVRANRSIEAREAEKANTTIELHSIVPRG